jgi:chemotaxis regulatin CheY-phosphate phosphatase CheZ
MPVRGRPTAKRRHRRMQAVQADERPGSEEIAVLVNTLRELAAIRSTAEEAAARILDSAEGLLALSDKEEAKKAEEAILAIMTACGFHDLVGQRVSKIAESLDRVIVGRMSRPRMGSRNRKSRLEGPGLPGTSEQAQARIDALFGKD